MGTPNDQAVLRAIFNPDTPFGDVVGLDLEEDAEKEADGGKYLTLEPSSPPGLVCCPHRGDREVVLQGPLFHDPWMTTELGIRGAGWLSCTDGGLAKSRSARRRKPGFISALQPSHLCT